MKHYEFGTWGLGFIWTLEGSVFPRALAWALPNALLAVALWYVLNEDFLDADSLEDLRDITTGQIWVGYNWGLGFLVSFRATRAYARWWEGGTLLQQARGEWFNAYSSLIAFCSDKPEKKMEVDSFQQLLARLVSMLYGAALQTVSMSDNLNFELIDFSGVDKQALMHLLEKPDKVEIILQWIQRLIVININNGVVPIAPPILSRAFQELSRGVVNMHNVRKITEFQFPFPFAQMITTMLIIQWLVTPVAASSLVGSPAWAAVLSFVPTFAFWGINYISAEIEQPFGDDSNDMPMVKMQSSMNASILALLETSSQNPPSFTMAPTFDSTESYSSPTTSVAALTAVMHKMRTLTQKLSEKAPSQFLPQIRSRQSQRRTYESGTPLRSVRFSETDRISIRSCAHTESIDHLGSGNTSLDSLRHSLRPSYVVAFSHMEEAKPLPSLFEGSPKNKEDGGSDPDQSAPQFYIGKTSKKGNVLRFDVPSEEVHGSEKSKCSDGSIDTDVHAYRVSDSTKEHLVSSHVPLRTIPLSPGKCLEGIDENDPSLRAAL